MSRTALGDDTDVETRREMTALYARMTPEAKLRRVGDLTAAVNQLALAGLRIRHPGDGEPALLLRLARLRLGDAVVMAAYEREAPGRGA